MPKPTRDYRHYPAAYAEVVERLAATGEPQRLGPMPYNEARRVRQDISWWLARLRQATETGDPYALDLVAKANRGLWTIDADPDGSYIILRPNALVTAWEGKESKTC